MKALLLQSNYDKPTAYQHDLLLRQRPVIEALKLGIADLIAGKDLVREKVVKLLKKEDYAFIYIGSHTHDYKIRGYGGSVILKPSDKSLFLFRRVYAFVCKSYNSRTFEKAKEAILYKGRYIFPNIGDPRYAKNEAWHIITLGFYPLNRSLEFLIKGVKPDMLQIFEELKAQFEKAKLFVESDLGRFALANNLRALRYLSYDPFRKKRTVLSLV